MKRNIITFLINRLQIFHMMNVARQIPRGIHRHIRIVSIYFHTKMKRRIRHQHANGSKTDHAKLLSFNLLSGKHLFLLLRCLCDILFSGMGLHPLDASDDIAGRQKHPRNHQLFHPVCVRSRRIKDYNSFFRAVFQRNIIHSGSRPCDCL